MNIKLVNPNFPSVTFSSHVFILAKLYFLLLQLNAFQKLEPFSLIAVFAIFSLAILNLIVTMCTFDDFKNSGCRLFIITLVKVVVLL